MPVSVIGSGVLTNSKVSNSPEIAWPAGHAADDVLIAALTTPESQPFVSNSLATLFSAFDTLLIEGTTGSAAADILYGLAIATAGTSSEANLVLYDSRGARVNIAWAVLRGTSEADISIVNSGNSGNSASISVTGGTVAAGSWQVWAIHSGMDEQSGDQVSGESATGVSNLTQQQETGWNSGSGSRINLYTSDSPAGGSYRAADGKGNQCRRICGRHAGGRGIRRRHGH